LLNAVTDLDICHEVLIAADRATWVGRCCILTEVWRLWLLLAVNWWMIKWVDSVAWARVTLLELNLLISESTVNTGLNPKAFIKILESIAFVELDNLNITPMQMPMFILIWTFS